MPRQTLVHERVVGVQKIENATVFVHDRREEESRFLEHGVFQGCVEVGEELGVRRERRELPSLEPLACELFGQSTRPAVPKHPLHLSSQQIRATQGFLAREAKKLVVGHAAPQEIRKARGELKVVCGSVVRRGSRAGRLDADEEKVGR